MYTMSFAIANPFTVNVASVCFFIQTTRCVVHCPLCAHFLVLVVVSGISIMLLMQVLKTDSCFHPTAHNWLVQEGNFVLFCSMTL